MQFLILVAPFLAAALFVLVVTALLVYQQSYIRSWKKHGYTASEIPMPILPEDFYYTFFVRWRRLPRTLTELALPPHLICPFNSLPLKHWRKIAEDFWPAWYEAGNNDRDKKFDEFLNERLRASGLPLLPLEKW